LDDYETAKTICGVFCVFGIVLTMLGGYALIIIPDLVGTAAVVYFLEGLFVTVGSVIATLLIAAKQISDENL
jgi:hypothetical protein